MECPGCGEDMRLFSVPHEWLVVKIPLTRIEVRVWRWKMEPTCVDCNSAKDADTERAIAEGNYSAGYSDGWEAKARLGDAR